MDKVQELSSNKIILYKLSVLKRKLQRTIFGLNTMKNEISGVYRLPHNEKLYDPHLSVIDTKTVKLRRLWQAANSSRGNVMNGHSRRWKNNIKIILREIRHEAECKFINRFSS
jgi:hypothetical protein